MSKIKKEECTSCLSWCNRY